MNGKRPRVTVHNAVSLDGRVSGFPVDVGLYYELAAQLPQDAVLAGSGTMLAAAAGQGVDLSGDDPDEPPPAVVPDDPRPWLVIVDSRGRIGRLGWLRDQPYWRDVLVLCSAATPAEHLDRLRRHRVEHLVAGDARVDLAAALAALSDRYGVRDLRVDAGGALNARLLQAGLVDELSLLVAPYLAQNENGEPPVRLLDADVKLAGQRLALTEVQRLRDDYVWLRYDMLPPA
jgi:2,5-diamino-6-(ribosylamino)-4(3H)-pyrimidinone 5'-phosphate reductase